MATVQSTARYTREIAEYLASLPFSEQLLDFHPSDAVQQRASELLQKSTTGQLSAEERWELDQFEHAERLMKLVKSRIRAERGSQP